MTFTNLELNKKEKINFLPNKNWFLTDYQEEIPGTEFHNV